MTTSTLLQATVLHRIEILKRIRMELTESRLDSDRKVLMGLAVLDRFLGEAKQEAAALAPAVDTSEDGGYIDRDPLQNAVKGDLP